MRIKTKNNLSFKARIAAAVIAFVLSMLCVMSLTIPASQLHFEKKIVYTDDLVAEITPANIKYFSNCNLVADGEISITGEDSHIVFSGFGTEIQAVKLNFNRPSENYYYATLYYDNGQEFAENKVERQYVFTGDECVVFEIPKTANKNLRIDIDENYTLKSIELHSKAPITTDVPIKVSAWKYIIAFLISLLIAVIFFFFDKYIYPVSEKIKNYYLRNYKNILIDALLILISVIVSIGIESILSHFVFGVSSTGVYFNGYRYFFIVCVLSYILLLIKHIKNGANTEKLFVVSMLAVGICMIICTPFGHICWDYDSHSKFVLTKSYIGDAYITAADDAIFTTKEFYLRKETALDNLTNIEYINSLGSRVVGIHSGTSTIAHFPTGLAVAVSRFLGFPYVTTIMFGRTANLIVYVLVCYFAMRKLKSGKIILATIAFFPTNLYLATNYSYDFWVTAFIFLGISYFISEIRQPRKQISVKDTVIMNAAFILACIPKQIYMPIMILPLFMRKDWKNKPQRKKYYLICLAMIAFMLTLLVVRAFSSVTGGGDTRGGSGVNSMGQFSFILSEPFHYAKILLNFLKTYLSIGQMNKYINSFSYLGEGVAEWVFIIMLMFATLTDKDENERFKGMNLLRIVNIILFFGLICLVATSMYISFTEVRNETIAGCQARYITPLLFPLLIFIANPGIKLKLKNKIYNTTSLVILSSAVFIDIGYVFLPKIM